MKITFHGGARCVTGACHLVETSGLKLLIDCGLFQGAQECEDNNFEDFKFDPASIDILLVTHAHLDHIGRIPKLVQKGFAGKIYSTPPTKDLASLLLDDAMSISRKQNSEETLYTEEYIAKALDMWEVISYEKELQFKDVKIKLHNAGHILGSALIEIFTEGKRVLFTGDLGNMPSVLLPPPKIFNDIDIMIIESVYGMKEHEDSSERNLILERAVEDVAARKGTLLIPAFATERTQDITYLLNEMLLKKRIPDMPVFIDSPLAIKITDVFEKYLGYYNEDIQKLIQQHPNLFKTKKLQFTSTVEESKKINDISPPKVVVAGSGAMNGGRILHHARRYLPDPKNILLMVGYQGPGSLGRRIVEGDRLVKIQGEDIPVEAEIRQNQGFSAHADSGQLFSFINASRDTLKQVFVVQGEEEQAMGLAQRVKDNMGIQADAPELHQQFDI